MADAITGVNTGKVDASKWKKLTVQEIIKEKSKGEDIPAEIVTWAQQMAAFAKIPDDVTYEDVDGETGIDALNKLGIEDDSLAAPQAENAQDPTETDQPDAVKDPARSDKTEQDENIFAKPEDTTQKPEETTQEEAVTLADTNITADEETIRKRKAKRGIQ